MSVSENFRGMGCVSSCGVKKPHEAKLNDSYRTGYENRVVAVPLNDLVQETQGHSDPVKPVSTPIVPSFTPSSELSTALLSNVTDITASGASSTVEERKTRLNEKGSASVTLYMSSSGKYHRVAECAGKAWQQLSFDANELPGNLCRRACCFPGASVSQTVERKLDFSSPVGKTDAFSNQRGEFEHLSVHDTRLCPLDLNSTAVVGGVAVGQRDEIVSEAAEATLSIEPSQHTLDSTAMIVFVSSTGKYHLSQACAGTKAKSVTTSTDRLPAHHLCKKACCFKQAYSVGPKPQDSSLSYQRDSGSTPSSVFLRTQTSSRPSPTPNNDDTVTTSAHDVITDAEQATPAESAKICVETSPLPPSSITVASWNVCGSQSEMLQDGFMKKDGIATALRFLYENFDVVSLQEVAKPLARQLKSIYPGHFYCHDEELERRDARMLNGWLTRLAPGQVSQYDWEAGVSRSGAGRVLGEPIRCTYKHVTIRVETGEGELYLTSFHTPGSSKSARAREAEVRAIVNHLSDVSVSRPDVTHVFAGDANWHLLPVDSRVYARSKCDAHVPSKPTTDTSKLDRTAADVLLSTTGKVVVSPVLAAPQLYGSDHKFIYCSLSMIVK